MMENVDLKLKDLKGRLAGIGHKNIKWPRSLEFLPESKMNSDAFDVMRGYQKKLESIGEEQLLEVFPVGRYCRKIKSFCPLFSFEEEKAIVLLAQQGNKEACDILLKVLLPLVYEVSLELISQPRDGDLAEKFEELSGNCLDTLIGVVYEDLVGFKIRTSPKGCSLRAFVASCLRNRAFNYLRRMKLRDLKYEELRSMSDSDRI